MAQVNKWELTIMIATTTLICWWLHNNINGGAYLTIGWIITLLIWCWIRENNETHNTSIT